MKFIRVVSLIARVKQKIRTVKRSKLLGNVSYYAKLIRDLIPLAKSSMLNRQRSELIETTSLSRVSNKISPFGKRGVDIARNHQRQKGIA